MMSLERLYSLVVIKTVSVETQRGSGRGVFSREDAMGVISKVESKYEIGSAILSASISGDKAAITWLENVYTEFLKLCEIDSDISRALAVAAVTEVCSSPQCTRCNGRGETISKGMITECSKCHGSGAYVPSKRELHRLVISELPSDKQFSRDTFTRKWCNLYVNIVDRLHIEAGEAGKYAKKILNSMADEMAQA
ncbi:molecular chaperone [Pseudoalteromonas phage vB_Pun_Y3]